MTSSHHFMHGVGAVKNFAKRGALPSIAHGPSYPVQTVTHKQRVCRLYKRLYRMKEADSYYDRDKFLIWRNMLRYSFDINANIQDERECNRLLEMGEQELKRIHVEYLYQFPSSPKGVTWDRYDHYPRDCFLDSWHDNEKAMFPDYFAKRQQRLWEQKEWAKGKLAEYDAYFEEWKKENPELYEEYRWMYEPEWRYVNDHYPHTVHH